MSELEFPLIAKIFGLVLIAIVCAWSKLAYAQASILESTPTGTTFCSTANAQSSVDMSACADAMMIPMGTTGQRPLSPVSGMIRYDMGSSNIEAYTGSSWWAMVAQQQSDYSESNSSLSDYIKNKPTIPVVQSYEGTTQRLNPILINKTAAVAGGAGVASFNLTNDGTSTGTALCPNGVMLNSPNLSVNDATNPYQFGWSWANSNKTMNVTTYKASGLAVLTFTLLGVPAPVANGTNVNETVVCY